MSSGSTTPQAGRSGGLAREDAFPRGRDAVSEMEPPEGQEIADGADRRASGGRIGVGQLKTELPYLLFVAMSISGWPVRLPTGPRKEGPGSGALIADMLRAAPGDPVKPPASRPFARELRKSAPSVRSRAVGTRRRTSVRELGIVRPAQTAD